MKKRLVIFTAMLMLAGVAKAGWFETSQDQYTVVFTSATTAVSLSTTVCLVALSSNTWPHPTDARAIIVDSVQVDNDKAAASTSLVKLGVVREINGSSGTIVYFDRMGQALNVSNTNTARTVDFVPGLNCRVNPRSPNFGPNLGSTPYIYSNDTVSAIAISTKTLVMSPTETVNTYSLKAGDIVATILNGAAATNLEIRVRYHIEPQ